MYVCMFVCMYVMWLYVCTIKGFTALGLSLQHQIVRSWKLCILVSQYDINNFFILFYFFYTKGINDKILRPSRIFTTLKTFGRFYMDMIYKKDTSRLGDQNKFMDSCMYQPPSLLNSCNSTVAHTAMNIQSHMNQPSQ